MRLNSKVALVTGGASGIGEGIVRRFVAEGARVWLADVSEEQGRSVAEQTGATFVRLDVSQEADWADAMRDIAKAHGRLDILVNNAGIISNEAIDAVTIEAWNRAIAINLTGPMLGCRAAIDIMRHQSDPIGGSIINVGSTTSFLGLANDAVYTATKTAILGLTRSAAAQCAKMGWSIRVNSLHPGTTDTEILRRHIATDPSMLDRFNAMSPLGRMARVEEEAAMAVFLASEEASYCTGSAYMADGGLTATHPGM